MYLSSSRSDYKFVLCFLASLHHSQGGEAGLENQLLKMKIWAEKTTICIQVNPHYVYWAKVSKIGKIGDSPSMDTMWGWIEHLKEKVWWTPEIQRSFIELAELALEHYGKSTD